MMKGNFTMKRGGRKVIDDVYKGEESIRPLVMGNAYFKQMSVRDGNVCAR